MLERAMAQIDRASFGSFDHLAGQVTSDNSGAAGDYLPGSLRIEVHLKGDAASSQIRSNEEVLPIISHELHHAASAQSVKEGRIGLKSFSGGLEANEAMTEFLSQISSGTSGISGVEDGFRVDEDISYHIPVVAMLVLYQQYASGINQHFALLFNAYHGDVRDTQQLKNALDAFYKEESAYREQINNNKQT
jgi:hypothetical protein